jgi:hypothetical protein
MVMPISLVCPENPSPDRCERDRIPDMGIRTFAAAYAKAAGQRQGFVIVLPRFRRNRSNQIALRIQTNSPEENSPKSVSRDAQPWNLRIFCRLPRWAIYLSSGLYFLFATHGFSDMFLHDN